MANEPVIAPEEHTEKLLQPEDGQSSQTVNSVTEQESAFFIDEANELSEEDKYFKKFPLAKPPAELIELMDTIDRMLANGEEIPDSFIQEFEAQVNSAGEFDVEGVFSTFSNASQFYGINAILEEVRARNRIKHGFHIEEAVTQQHFSDMPDMPNIPVDVYEESMGYMGESDTYYDSSMAQSNVLTEVQIQSESPVVNQEASQGPTKPVGNSAETGVMEARKAENDIAATKANTASSSASDDMSPSHKSVETELPSRIVAPTKQDNPAENTPQQHPQIQQGGIPLLGSLSNTFSKMFGASKSKTVPTSVSVEGFYEKVFTDKISDFQKVCTNHSVSLSLLSQLVKGCVDTPSESDSKILATHVTGFTNVTKGLVREYENIVKGLPDDSKQLKRIKDIATDHSEKIKTIKDEIASSLGAKASASLSRLFGGVMESLNNLTNKVFKIKPENTIQAEKISAPQIG